MIVKKEMIAMLLAGGQGSRLGILTSNMAKPAVSFGGKYRIIDFPLSNCINSGVDTVGVLTQYMPLRLNTHVGIGIPWDLDKNVGGVTVLSPYEKIAHTDWYTGTANAIYQNLTYMESYNPDYVLILSGDHIYKMDYESMLDFHKENNAEVTIAVMPVPKEEASRFGIMITDENRRVVDFEEKPAHPRSNLASMGIYIFNWKTLREALVTNKEQPNLDFGKHIIPYCRDKGWEANMELIDIVPEFNLYEEYWKIYTQSTSNVPQYFGAESTAERTIIGEGTEIYGRVYNSVIGCDVTIGEGAEVRDSILMNGTRVGAGSRLYKVIAAENVTIGNGAVLGEGRDIPNETRSDIYRDGLVTLGEGTEIPAGVCIGKNVMISGVTTADDYPGGMLESGRTLVKEGDVE